MKVLIFLGLVVASATAEGFHDNGCPKDPTVYVSLPDSSDCSRFQICDNGKLVERQCPNGLHYSMRIQGCDWIETAGCVENGMPELTEEIRRTGSTLPNGCPANGQQTLLPHPNDCTQYYVCDHGRLIQKSCPAALHFNSKQQICDWPDQAKCEVQTNLPNGCPADPNVVFLMAHPTDCTHYYACDHGRLSEMRCPPPLHFNRKLQICDWEDSAACVIDGACPLDSSVTLLSHPQDCSLYYVCDHGRLVEMSCPPSLHFNKEAKICDWAHSAGCV